MSALLRPDCQTYLCGLRLGAYDRIAPVDYADICDAVAREVASFAGDTRGVDPATPVATCPPWDMGELVKHIGFIHRWAGQMMRGRAQARLSFKDVDLELPEDRTGYPDWLAAGGEPLVATLRQTDPDVPMWSWGADQHARFWARRQLHETAVHHADAVLALGRDQAIDNAQAVDGIDEFLENLPHAVSFAPNVKDLHGQGESLHLHCTDAEGEWMIVLNPNGFTWEHGHGKGSVAVRGTASDMLLLTYGRLKPDGNRFQVFGDEGVLARWLASAHI
jgi:uncharacterized protein (TIGR03083 family)